MPRTSTPSPADLPLPSARHLPRVRRGDGWDALADIEVFVFAVEAELEAMERERVGVHRRGRQPDLGLRRRRIGLIWTLTFGGMQGRVAAGCRVFRSPLCTAPSPAGPGLGCGDAWASVWPATGAWPATTRSCPQQWWPTAVPCALP